jgi:predicted  nucleic acid-binding Zn-ribbon protein
VAHNVIDQLLIVQDRDRTLARLRREAQDVPARQKMIEAQADRERKELLVAQEQVKKKLSAAKQVELEVGAHQERIAKLRMQQTQVKTNEEYRALEKEIKTAQDEIRKLEDGELEVMEEIEALRQIIAGRESDLKKRESEIKVQLIDMHQRLAALQKEIEETQTQRAGLVKDVAPDWLGRYERVFQHNGEFGVVPVENGACGGCHMKLPAQVVHDAKKTGRMVLCNFCGAILFWKP